MAPANSNRFVIFCTARSGSSRLVEFLNQFPSIICYGELFKRERLMPNDLLKAVVPFDIKQRDRRPLAYLNSVYSLSPTKITGFKIFYSHPETIRESLLLRPGMKKVILHRNAIDMYLSFVRARVTAEWVKVGNQESVATPPLFFNAAKFAQLAIWHKKYYRRLRVGATRKPSQFFYLDYADIGNGETLRQLAAFLGETLLSVPLEETIHKQFVERYQDVMTNYDEMIEVLRRDYPKLLEKSDVARQNSAAAV